MSGHVQRRDVEIVFYEHHDGEGMRNQVLVSLGDGRAQSTMTLEEFCGLLADCRKEISRLHWQPGTEERA